mgnify:CR=1 FL=1
MRLRLIDRYLIGKFLSTFLFMVLLISFVAALINFSENLNKFIDRNVPFSLLLTDYYPHMILFIANLLSPICTFLAVILFTSNLAQKSEFVALLSGGISFYRLLAPYVATAVVLGGLTFYLNAYIVPDSVRKQIDFENQRMKRRDNRIERNVHRKVSPTEFVYFHSWTVADNDGYRFVLEEMNGSRVVRRLEADRLTYDRERKVWRLFEVVERHFRGDTQTLSRKAAEDLTLRLEPADLIQSENFAESMPLDVLDEYIALEQMRGSDYVEELILERYERYAYPFATLILTLIGFAMASRKRRGGIALQLGVGFALSFVYILILTTAKVAISDTFPGWLAVWLPNIVFGLLALVLLRLAPK